MNQNSKVTPLSLSNYWKEKHNNNNDVQIALDYLDLIESTLPISKGGDMPIIVHMIGTPGSGKTTLVNTLFQHPKIIENNLFHLGFDRTMEILPSYHQDLKTLSAKEAFKRWELPARVAGYALLEKLIRRSASLVFDHTASDIRHIELLKTIRDIHGYKVIMIYPKTTLETSLRRVEERMLQQGARHTPKEMVLERYEILLGLVGQYKEHFSVMEIENDKPLEKEQLEEIVRVITELAD